MKLIIENLSKSFGKKEVLNNASFTFEKGIIYALLGRNGSGKTTLFRLITDGLDKDNGEVFLEENGIKRKLEFKDIFFMVAEPELPKFLTGYEFIKFFIEANKENIKSSKTIEEYFDLVDFEMEDSHRLIQGYSTGMKNKIQMLMFLILRPRVILMDEPLTSLDVVVQLEMKKIIREIHADHIIIFSTHILQLAKDICDEIVLLSDKKLQKVEENLIKNPDFEDKIISLLSGEKESLKLDEELRKIDE
ncbi:ATP-binding cassette domain-containing protein [Anaerococcus sp. NML200574]|uniref:ABC transporter ATP-binding protein n=1 Tax=unclassified Anaerococcus TaxID=2614126 RepID=UPI002237E317|nr:MULTISPECIES: ATP-binding cassette domain-containing protein [unclassified Anaerococcus]MCW6679404.1 ATP-binding cassette domain-containing protein [Anaerococcus sp. NML200574]MCW6702489.1 ATP-binding cassette domain-containing protein [Anaerococcus sp. NML200537]